MEAPLRIYHHELIPAMPDPLLRALHRDLCNLRGRGWGKKSPALRHLAQNTIQHLLQYHTTVLHEMIRRRWKPCSRWFEGTYRGRNLKAFDPAWVEWTGTGPLYPEHTDHYRQQGVAFLRKKLIDPEFHVSIKERERCAAALDALEARKKAPRNRMAGK